MGRPGECQLLLLLKAASLDLLPEFFHTFLYFLCSTGAIVAVSCLLLMILLLFLLVLHLLNIFSTGGAAQRRRRRRRGSRGASR